MNTLSPSLFTETGTTKITALGHRMVDDSTDRVWRYALNASSIGPGKLLVAATQEAQHIDLAPTGTFAAGVKVVEVTLGSTAATVNLYQDGWAVVQDNTGEGRAYPIEGHPAAALSSTLNIQLKEALSVGVDTTTDIDLTLNKYASIVISATDQADQGLGVFNVTVGNTTYGWLQTWGPAAVWHDESVTVGLALTTGTGTAGQFEALDGAGEPEYAIQGPVAGADGDYQLADLRFAR